MKDSPFRNPVIRCKGCRDRFLHYGTIYKDFIRPLPPTCRVYHHDPVSARGGVESSPWFAIAFASPERDRGCGTVVRIASRGEDSYVFRTRGLSLAREYRIILDNTGDAPAMDGIQLMRDGSPWRSEFIGQLESVTIQSK